MKTLIAILILIIPNTGSSSADEALTEERAISILETSLNKQERIKAVAALANPDDQTASPIAVLLGRTVAANPTSDEAMKSLVTLGLIGRPSIPIVAGLVPNGLDYSYLCAKITIPRFPQKLEEDLLAALMPPNSVHAATDRSHAALALRWFPLSSEAANRVTTKLLEDPWHESNLKGALFLAPKCNDPAILTRIRANKLLSMKYLGARLAEEWRRKNSNRLLIMPANQELPEGEQKEREEANAELAEKATAAIPEALQRLKTASYVENKYIWMETLKALSDHATLPLDETLKILDRVPRKRGSTLDLLLVEFRAEITAKSEQASSSKGG